MKRQCHRSFKLLVSEDKPQPIPVYLWLISKPYRSSGNRASDNKLDRCERILLDQPGLVVSPETERRLRLWLLYYSSLLTYCQMNLQLICALWHWYTVSSVPNLGLVCDTGQNGSYSCFLALFIQMPNLLLRNLLVTERFSSHKDQGDQSYSCRHYAIANLSHCWAKSEQKYHSTIYIEPPKCDKNYALKKVCALVSHPKWEIANALFFLCSFYLFFDCCFCKDRQEQWSLVQPNPTHLFQMFTLT